MNKRELDTFIKKENSNPIWVHSGGLDEAKEIIESQAKEIEGLRKFLVNHSKDLKQLSNKATEGVCLNVGSIYGFGTAKTIDKLLNKPTDNGGINDTTTDS